MIPSINNAKHAILLLILLNVLVGVHASSSVLRNRKTAMSDDNDIGAPGRLPGDALYKSVSLGRTGGCSGNQEAILDIYRSNNSIESTTVLLLPGGAYMNHIGDTIAGSAGESYFNAGYTLAVLYYRLPRSSTEQSWLLCSDPMEALEDVQLAMNELQTNSVEYHVNPSAIITSGFSAGGHLAALHGTTCSDDDGDKHCPSAMVLHFPFLETGARIFCTTPIGSAFSNTEDFGSCFPTALVTENTPPVVMYHANGDPIVPVQWMTDMEKSLIENNVAYSYYEVPSGGHYLVDYDQVVQVSDGTLSSGNEYEYAGLIQRALELIMDTCTACNNIPTQWMTNNGQTCDSGTWMIENRCNDSLDWENNKYCQQSCYDAGRGYDGDNCCQANDDDDDDDDDDFVDDDFLDDDDENDDDGLSAPTSSPCSVCTDVPTPWMANNNKICQESQSFLGKNCNANTYWTTNTFCQQSCFDAGRGYGDDVCCSTEVICTECDDTPTSFMIQSDTDCQSMSTWFIDNKCNADSAWRESQFCRQSCYKAGKGYDDDSPCCE